MEKIEFATELPFYSRHCPATQLSRKQLEKMKVCAQEDKQTFQNRKAAAATAAQRMHANAAIQARTSIIARIDQLIAKY